MHKRLIKSEKGQAMVEFVLVLPVFLLLLFMIIDFGWLFYNQISVENAARNAARVACVSYTNIGVYDDGSVQPGTTVDVQLAQAKVEDERTPTEQLAVDMSKGMESTLSDIVMTIDYTTDEATAAHQTPTAYNRQNGDVTVTVSCKMRVLTPVLGVFSDDMKRTITTDSTFKVEKMESTSVSTT